MLVQSKSLIDAAKRNGVQHIVHLGAFTTDHDSYATVFAWHQMIEAYLRNSGVAWTNLHPNMFMQNLLTYTSIRGGQYRPYTSKALGFTALEDLAEAAATPSASPGSGQRRSRTFQLHPASSDLKSPWLLAA
jgi:NAD(P)H dehydrogenase (quinone)